MNKKKKEKKKTKRERKKIGVRILTELHRRVYAGGVRTNTCVAIINQEVNIELETDEPTRHVLIQSSAD